MNHRAWLYIVICELIAAALGYLGQDLYRHADHAGSVVARRDAQPGDLVQIKGTIDRLQPAITPDEVVAVLIERQSCQDSSGAMVMCDWPPTAQLLPNLRLTSPAELVIHMPAARESAQTPAWPRSVDVHLSGGPTSGIKPGDEVIVLGAVSADTGVFMAEGLFITEADVTGYLDRRARSARLVGGGAIVYAALIGWFGVDRARKSRHHVSGVAPRSM